MPRTRTRRRLQVARGGALLALLALAGCRHPTSESIETPAALAEALVEAGGERAAAQRELQALFEAYRQGKGLAPEGYAKAIRTQRAVLDAVAALHVRPGVLRGLHARARAIEQRVLAGLEAARAEAGLAGDEAGRRAAFNRLFEALGQADREWMALEADLEAECATAGKTCSVRPPLRLIGR